MASYSLNFTGLSNENPLSQGGAWVTKSGNDALQVLTGAARGTSLNSASLIATGVATFNQNQTARAVITATGNDDHAGLVVLGDFAVRVLKNTNTLTLLRWNGTVWGFEASTSHTWVNGDELAVITAPSGGNMTFDVRVNNTNIWSPTVTGASGQTGQPGLYYSAGNVNATGITSFSVLDSAGTSPAITDVDTDESVAVGQTSVAVTGTDLTGATFALVDGTITTAQPATGVTATAATLTAIALGECRYGVRTLRATTGSGTGTIALTVTPQTGRKYVDIGVPNASAPLRITSIPDLVPGDQVEWSNVQGGAVTDVTVYSDGSFSCASSVTSFDVRVHDGTSWGSVGTQSVATSADSTAPTVPGSVSVAQTGPAQFAVTWGASTDVGSGLGGYRVRRNGALLAEPIAGVTSYVDSTPVAGVEYTYTVSAFDVAGNESGVATAAPIMLAGAVTPPTPSPGVPGGTVERVSKVSIANLALTKLGALPIESFTEDSKGARVMSLLFDRIRDAELSRRWWNFAKARRKLAEVINDEPRGPFRYAYALPADWLSTIYVGLLPSALNLADFREYDPGAWSHEGLYILTNEAPPADLHYVRRITNPTQYHALFVEALACRLAMEAADALTASLTRWEKCAAEYKAAIGEARRMNAIQNPPQTLQDSEWLASRY